MSGSFSLVEKLAVVGAFCALVVLAVGTESDPGVVAASQAQPRTAIATAHKAVPGKSASDWWSPSSGAPAAVADGARPAPPPPEILPPGFGATPSPDLPQ